MYFDFSDHVSVETKIHQRIRARHSTSFRAYVRARYLPINNRITKAQWKNKNSISRRGAVMPMERIKIIPEWPSQTAYTAYRAKKRQKKNKKFVDKAVP